MMKNIIALPRIRMLLVGALSVILAYLVFLALISVGIHYLIASVANFLAYLLINFFLNKTWAFKSKGNTRNQALAHTSLHLGNQLMIMVGLYVLVELLFIAPAWAQIIMQIVAFIVVFTVTPLIFKKK